MRFTINASLSKYEILQSQKNSMKLIGKKGLKGLHV